MWIIIWVLLAIILVAIASFVYIYFQNEEKHFSERVTELQVKTQVHSDQKDDDNNDIDISLWLSAISIKHKDFLLLKNTLSHHIVWLEWLLHTLLIALLCQWHVLVEWAPWLAKTKTVATFAQSLSLWFKRIQFTSDMLPSDIIWSEIFDPKKQQFQTILWPLLTNIVLADEINRTTPKVQSSLLEAMQEKQISIAWISHVLPHPFMVLATQNPIEQEWTYPLPEAQLDRFLCKVIVDYPTYDQEIDILRLIESSNIIQKKSNISAKKISQYQQAVWEIHMSDEVRSYVVDLVQATREDNVYIRYGASPRASISLMQVAKAVAYLDTRDYVTHDDVDAWYISVLRHRIILSYQAELENKTHDDVLFDIYKKTKSHIH